MVILTENAWHFKTLTVRGTNRLVGVVPTPTELVDGWTRTPSTKVLALEATLLVHTVSTLSITWFVLNTSQCILNLLNVQFYVLGKDAGAVGGLSSGLYDDARGETKGEVINIVQDKDGKGGSNSNEGKLRALYSPT